MEEISKKRVIIIIGSLIIAFAPFVVLYGYITHPFVMSLVIGEIIIGCIYAYLISNKEINKGIVITSLVIGLIPLAWGFDAYVTILNYSGTASPSLYFYQLDIARVLIPIGTIIIGITCVYLISRRSLVDSKRRPVIFLASLIVGIGFLSLGFYYFFGPWVASRVFTVFAEIFWIIGTIILLVTLVNGIYIYKRPGENRNS
jgi:hypothetical protein